jgi:hypothetical protein
MNPEQTPQQSNQNLDGSPGQTPNSQSPQYTAPSAGTPQPPPAQGKSNVIRTVIIAVVLLLLAGVGFAYYQHKNKKPEEFGGSVSLNGSKATASTCIPITATSLDQASMISEYKKFADAVKSNNQNCADGLSTSFFMALAKQTFSVPDGKWIASKNPINKLSMNDYFTKLPSTLQDSSFRQKDYTRATVVGMQSQPESGTTLSYPVDLSALGDKSKNQISISFVLENSQIKVDDILVEPQQ